MPSTVKQGSIFNKPDAVPDHGEQIILPELINGGRGGGRK